VVNEDDGPCHGALPGSSRRALLSAVGATLVGAGALALAGCGRKAPTGSKAVKKAHQPVQQSDVAILERLLGLERWTIAAYTAGIPLLTRPDAKTAKQFLDEELEHAGELLSLIKAAGGGKGPPRASSYNLGKPSDGVEVLQLLRRLEGAQIDAYLYAIPKLSPGAVRAAASSILANDAQHIAIIRAGLGLPAAPSPFVTGNE
jgi:Ferritin-like domain